MFKLKTLAIAVSAFSIVACSSRGDESLTSSGETIMNAKVIDMTVIGQDGILSEYPELAANVSTLESVTHVNHTDADTFDFYANEEIVLILGMNEDGSLMVLDSMNENFSADLITLT